MQKAHTTQNVDNQNSEDKIKEMDESGSPGILNPSSTIAAYEDFLNKFKDIDLSYGQFEELQGTQRFEELLLTHKSMKDSMTET
tara:strand:- start:327 stop:578 length:252 start_codon:yes stop_codon:yes gene_type:complete